MTTTPESLKNHGKREEALGIEVTSKCNSACLHCFARSETSGTSSLSSSLVMQIIREGYGAAYRRLHITGGEPLLWEGLIDVLDYAFLLGYEDVFLNSNGSLLTPDVARRLTAYNGLTVSISLDGPKGMHEHLRGRGTWQRTIEHIEGALDCGIKLFIFTTVCRPLVPDLIPFVRETYRRFPDVEGVMLIQLIRAKEGHFELKQELLAPEDYLRMAQSISLLNLFGLKTYLLRNPLLQVVSRLFKTPWTPQPYPMYRNGSMFVLSDREMTLTHSDRVRLGTYQSGMIEKILASDSYRKAVGMDTATCPTCKYESLCRESDMIRPSENTLDMHPQIPYCQRVIRLGLLDCQEKLNATI